MGCISSKHVAHSTISPIHHSSLTVANHHNNHNYNYGLISDKIKEEIQDVNRSRNNHDSAGKQGDVVLDIRGDASWNHDSVDKHSKKPSFSFSIKFGRSTVAEHVAAGWPVWLSAVAGEAIDGWLPLKSDSFERLEKVCHSTVYTL